MFARRKLQDATEASGWFVKPWKASFGQAMTTTARSSGVKGVGRAGSADHAQVRPNTEQPEKSAGYDVARALA